MDLTTLTLAELNALFSEKKAAFDAIKAKAAPTVADLDSAEGLAADLAAISAAQQKFASLAGLEESFSPKAKDADDKADKEVQAPEDAPVGSDSNPETNVEGDGRVVAPSEEINESTVKGGTGNSTPGQTQVTEQQVDVPGPGEVAGTDGGAPLQARSAVEALAGQRPDQSKAGASYRRTGGSRIVATPDLEKVGIAAGQKIDMLQTAEAVLARTEGFPAFSADAVTPQMLERAAEDPMAFIKKAATAAFAFDVPSELMVDDRMSEGDIEDVLNRAADEASLPGGSLVAAGGWCAPSETVYDLSMDATTDGMFSLPEIGIRRGGLKWPISPNFAAFYANPGFRQTETQAIAGTTKTCVEVDCPSWDEKRMSVEGLCIKVPILTEVGYPEHVKNFVDGTLVAHQHWMNAHFISEVQAMAGAAKVITGLGATTTDLLNGLEILAERVRQTYRLGFNQTLEVVLPHWVLIALRADISNRSALAIPDGVADAKLMSLFRERKLNVQFVYDWQELPTVDNGGTAGVDESVEYPGTVDALMYPAGTVFKGTQPVINLSTVYDAASLQVNTYTGLFTEQGYLVGKRKFHVTRVTIPICNAGRTGAGDLTCA